jgi:hypothetical protein
VLAAKAEGLAGPVPGDDLQRWDGSCLYGETRGGPWEDMSADDVAALRASAGDRPYTIAGGGSGRREDWEAERDHIQAVAAAGADWWIEWVPPGDRETMVAAVERGRLQPSRR